MRRLAWFSKTSATLLSLALSAGLFSACGQFQPKEGIDAVQAKGKTADQKEKVSQSDDPEAESILLADEGEDLLKPQTLEQARAKFQAALNLDPNNGRARFWLEWIKALSESKGIVSRIRPIYEKVTNGAVRYAMLTNDLDQRLPPSLRRYLLDGPQDIATMEEFQEWMDRVILRLSNLRKYIRENKQNEIRIRIPTDFIASLGFRSSAPRSREKNECESTNFGPVTLKLGTCSYKDVALNRADFEAIQQMVGYYEMFFTVVNAYRINPSLFVRHESFSLENGIKELTKENFGTLRSGQQRRTGIKELTSDLVLALQYFTEHQKETCKKGFSTKTNRPGYLLETGFCMNLDSEGKPVEERTISLLEKFIAGEDFSSYMMFQNEEQLMEHNAAFKYLTGSDYVHWSIYPLKVFENPPRSLKEIIEYKKLPGHCQASILSEKGMAPYMLNGQLGSLGVLLGSEVCNPPATPSKPPQNSLPSPTEVPSEEELIHPEDQR